MSSIFNEVWVPEFLLNKTDVAIIFLLFSIQGIAMSLDLYKPLRCETVSRIFVATFCASVPRSTSFFSVYMCHASGEIWRRVQRVRWVRNWVRKRNKSCEQMLEFFRVLHLCVRTPKRGNLIMSITVVILSALVILIATFPTDGKPTLMQAKISAHG